MHVRELLDIANAAYPDEYLRDYYNDAGERVSGSGDTLAEFIVNEIIETVDAETDDATQLHNAAGVINLAIEQLQAVARQLRDHAAVNVRIRQ